MRRLALTTMPKRACGSQGQWRYDGSREVSFFVTEDALRNLAADRVLGESECLRAFDAHRPAVYKAASTAYERARKGSYELGREDFGGSNPHQEAACWMVIHLVCSTLRGSARPV
jgi:Protein of unknown function (DUF1488)